MSPAAAVSLDAIRDVQLALLASGVDMDLVTRAHTRDWIAEGLARFHYSADQIVRIWRGQPEPRQ